MEEKKKYTLIFVMKPSIQEENLSRVILEFKLFLAARKGKRLKYEKTKSFLAFFFTFIAACSLFRVCVFGVQLDKRNPKKYSSTKEVFSFGKKTDIRLKGFQLTLIICRHLPFVGGEG